jgi:GAF domain-containing protein
VIDASPTDVQPVFDAIVRSARRLLGGWNVSARRLVGDELVLAAFSTTSDSGDKVLRSRSRISLTEEPVLMQVVHSRVPLVVGDTETDPMLGSKTREQARARGFRSLLVVPLLHKSHVIGTLGVGRREPGPFTDDQVALLQTFADQAVIAIENVRLFNETTEALGQQTATSEILKVISGSPTDVQPVFDAIARNAANVCGAFDAIVGLAEGDAGVVRGHHGPIPPPVGKISLHGTVTGQAIREGRPVHVEDLLATEDFPLGRELARASGYRTVLCVPLLRDGAAIGAIGIRRTEVRPFTGSQIALLQTFADQAVIAIENVRLFTELQEKNSALTTAHARVSEALEQQTATAEILRVISSSPTDLQPVFDTIVRNAVSLCGAAFGGLHQVKEGRITLDAQWGMAADDVVMLQRHVFPLPLSRGAVTGRAILDRAVIHIPDIREDPEYRTPLMKTMQGYRTALGVPMIREGFSIGALALWRTEVKPFSETEIGLVRTFADQAVIAIENVRLFKELEARNRDLTESLDRQTATAEILRVIASSPTDLQPVFSAIAESAKRLLGAYAALITRLIGDDLHLGALTSTNPSGDEVARARFPIAVASVGIHTAAARTRAPFAVADIEADQWRPHPELQEMARARGWRSFLAVPMLQGDQVLGTIGVSRREPGAFKEEEIALLQTFADQAVIAIENVRLFTELQASNHELTTALDKQTATSDILRVISRSQTDVQPVFGAIVSSALRLLRAYSGALTLVEGDLITLVALTSTDAAGDATLRANFPQSLQSEGPHPLAIRDRMPLNIADAHTDPRLFEAQHVNARIRGYRSQVVVPMLHHNEAVGTISVTRREPGGFTDDEIALLQTFADQAVIAIENVRLFTELQARTHDLTRSVGQLTALGEVARAVSSTLDLETVLSTIVSRAIQLSGTDGGSVYEYDEATEEFSLRASRDLPEAYVEEVRDTRPRKGEGAVGRVAQTREPVQIADISDPAAYESRVRNTLLQIGLRALLAVPLIAEDQLVGALIVMRKRTGTFAAEEVTLLQTFATQSALAIQNARLFREIEEKSRQLELASQHKSEFLANMSHELRTPLNAIIGFSEVLSEKMFGELNEKQEEYSKDIHASGQHLLSLINDILDLSKIEAGRMELELTDFDLPTAIDNALMLVRERAGRRGITLEKSIDERLGEIRADERKIRQVVLNLLSNAIKFTPEGGRIEVGAVPKDGFVEVSVSDTGVGIAPEDQEAVFEEFRQVGTAAKKVEGTGLGLTLCRKFVELHGGRIWVKSQLGAGSTFTFTVPIRRGE